MKNEKTKWLEVHLNKAQGPIGKQDGLCLSIGNEGSGVTRQIAGVHTGIYDVVRTWRVDRAELLAAVEAPDISLTDYEAQRAALADKDAALGAADKALKNCESPVAASCSDSVRHVLEMIDNARALIAAALKAEEVKR